MRRAPRILMIDDDESHIFSTKGILEREGYEVMVHSSPLGATNLVKQTTPDVILLDVNMPGLPGDKLTLILRANPSTRSTPIVLYSSNDEDVLRQTVRDQQLDGYICKGSPSDLRSRMRFYLAQVTGRELTAAARAIRD